MRGTRYSLLLALLALSLPLVASTGGFSSASVPRGVDATIASDEEAYLGVERDCRNGTLYVTITNQFPAEEMLDVEITVNGSTKAIDGLGVGESRTVGFETVDAGDPVSVFASGGSATVRLERNVPTSC